MYIDNLAYKAAPKRKSLSPLAAHLLRNKLINFDDVILDYGCGYGSDVKFLREKGYNIFGYDPYYFPDLPHHNYTIVLCNYVLNTLSNMGDRLSVINHCTQLASKDIYFTANNKLFSSIEFRAMINIGSQRLSTKRSDRLFKVTKDSPLINIYSSADANRYVTHITNSGWLAPDGSFIEGFCTHFDSFNYSSKHWDDDYKWAAQRYYRLISPKPFLNPFTNQLTKSIYLCPHDNLSSRYYWAIQSILRRNALNRIKFHTITFDFISEFKKVTNFNFLDKFYRPIPDVYKYPKPLYSKHLV